MLFLLFIVILHVELCGRLVDSRYLIKLYNNLINSTKPYKVCGCACICLYMCKCQLQCTYIYEMHLHDPIGWASRYNFFDESCASTQWKFSKWIVAALFVSVRVCVYSIFSYIILLLFTFLMAAAGRIISFI